MSIEAIYYKKVSKDIIKKYGKLTSAAITVWNNNFSEEGKKKIKIPLTSAVPLINDNDINAVEKAVSYLDKLSFQSIPILSVGSCFIAGLVSDIPVKVDIDLLDDLRRPKSGTLNLESAWKTNIKK